MRPLLAFLALFAMVCAIPVPLHTQVLFRHGARTPITPFPHEDEYVCEEHYFHGAFGGRSLPRLGKIVYDAGFNVFPGNCGQSQLTKAGVEMHIALGEKMRASHPHWPLTLDDVYLRATGIQRTHESLSAWLTGAFPEAMAQEDAVYKVHTSDIAYDPFIPGPEGCPGSSARFMALYDTPEWHAFFDSMQEDKLRLCKIVGFSEEECNEDRPYVPRWFHLFDNFAARDAHGHGLPPGITESDVEITQRAAAGIVRLWCNDDVLYKMTYARGIEFHVRLLERAIGAHRFGRQANALAILSAHDLTVFEFVAAMAGPDWLQEWPPFAAVATLDLSVDDGQYMISASYQHTPVPLVMCDGALSCDARKVIKYLRETYIMSDMAFNDMCA